MGIDVTVINAAMKERFSNDLLGDLTNQGNEGWTDILESVLNAACQDGIEEYRIKTRCTYGEETEREKAEINIIVSFTMYKLYQYAQNTEMMREYELLLTDAVLSFLSAGNYFVVTNKAHASENRPVDYDDYKTSKSQVDASDLDSDNSVYIDPRSPYTRR